MLLHQKLSDRFVPAYVRQLHKVHEAQLLNYLGLSALSVGYLVFFRNPLLKVKRFVN